MNRRLVYILILVAFGLILTATAKYLPGPVVAGGVLIIGLLSITQSSISVYKKANATEQMSGLQKVSGIIIFAAAFGAIIGLMLIVFHLRHIGRPLLNFSLVLFIAGVVVGIIAPAKSSKPDVKRQTLFGRIIYSGIICTITGVVLRINHYPGGKILMFGGLSFVAIFLIFLIVYKKHAHTYSK